jgi:tetratricopeptide (TPR) repeat protein
VSWTEEVVASVRQHRRAVLLGVGGVALLVLSIGGVFAYRGYQQQQGSRAFQQGLSFLRQNEATEAVASFARAERLLPAGVARQLTLLYLGKARALQHQPEDAQRAYEQSLAEKVSEPYVAQIALLQLGQEAEKQQDLAQAQRWYRQAAETAGPLQETALLAAARVLEGLGDTQAAQSLYERFIEQHADSPLVDLVRQKSGK